MKKGSKILLFFSLTIFFCTILATSLRVNAASNPFTKYLSNGKINCTWYAWQQAHDRMGVDLPMLGNGGQWYSNAQKYSNLSYGTTPRVNSIVCWTNSGAGHVAYVTAVKDGYIWVDEGGRGSSQYDSTEGVATNQKRLAAVGSYQFSQGDSSLAGYIYLDEVKDTTSPSITNVYFSEQNNSYFKITYTLSDNVKVVKDQILIYCPHKTLVNTNENSGNNTWSMKFNWGNMPDGNYYCTITAWDAAGNKTTVTSPTITKKTPDTSAPTISNVKVTDVTDKGYTISCNVSDNVGVTKVQFPTWTDNNGQDDLIWHDAVISGNTASLRINVNTHNNEKGCYYNTHIYAWDAAGNQSNAGEYIWVPAKTNYKVFHYKEELNGEFKMVEQDNLSAESETMVLPETKNYSGFSSPSKIRAVINGNGSTTITYYYKRNTYNLVWDFDGGTGSGEYTNGSVKYEQKIEIPTVTKNGYKFLGWDKEIPDKMPDGDLTITAKWEKESNNTDVNNNSNNNNNNKNNNNNNNNNTSSNNENPENNNQNENLVNDFVVRFYITILGRKADESGLNNWTTALLNGEKTGADVARGFVLSSEFINQNNSNEQFVNKMYTAFFNRDADTDGYNNWINKLESGSSREQVLAGFVKSEEFKNLCSSYGIIPGEIIVAEQNNNQQVQQNNNQQTGQKPPLKLDAKNVNEDKLDEYVERLYSKVLGRQSEPEGKEYWKKAIKEGRDDRGNVYDAAIAARKGFFESQEYKEKNRTDDEFLMDLYAAFFNRTPDEEGYEYWQNKMKYEGYTRQRVIDEGFGHSQEFKNLLISYGFKIIG